MDKTFVDTIYHFFVNNRPKIIFSFKILYFFQVIYVGFTLFLRLSKNPLYGLIYPTATLAGEIAVTLFLFIMLPGIARRFGIKHKLLSILMIYRRYTGIFMFLFVTIHVWMLRIIPIFSGYFPSFPRPLFEISGFFAFVFLIPLFLTSNDWSLKKLKQHWYLLHRLVYIIMWLIIFHLLLQGISYAGIVAIVTTTLTSTGILYQHVIKKRTI